jgi:choline dehydrogenase-like flavoprotein
VKKAIIIGSGAGGATAAKELQGKFAVTILEAGAAFQPVNFSLHTAARLRKTGLFFNEREIQFLFPSMRVKKTPDKMVLVSGRCHGGTTTIATGNALRRDGELQKLGINLDQEFDELSQEIPITTDHQNHWKKSTRHLFEIFQQLGLNPKVVPKMGNYQHCQHCGHCMFGCPNGVKWDSRRFLKEATDHGARLISRCMVEKILIEDHRAWGVQARLGCQKKIFQADLIILAAGGLATPVILQNSNIPCESRLFIDPVLCVAVERTQVGQDREIPMPFAAQLDNYLLSPYFDYLSFFFNKKWHRPAENILSLMIKLADTNSGSINGHKLNKTLTTEDKNHLQKAVDICTEILIRLGVQKEDVFLGTINAGHPGGMFPLHKEDAQTFHPAILPENLYVADASLFPTSLGNPPSLTIMAMAKRISRICMNN